MADTTWEWSLHEHIPSSLTAGHELIERYIKTLEQFGGKVAICSMCNWPSRKPLSTPSRMATMSRQIRPSKSNCTSVAAIPACVSWIKATGSVPMICRIYRTTITWKRRTVAVVMLIKEMMDKVEYNACGNQSPC